MTELYEYSFPASSSLYNASKGLLFTRNGITCRVYNVFADDNNRNLDIGNISRVRSQLFDIIQNYYNLRIIKYDLTYSKLSKDQEDLLIIKKPKLVSSEIDGFGGYSGTYNVYPRQFVCKKCGDLQQPNHKQLEHFSIHKCKNKDCDGEYEQVSVLRFCETCGKVDIFYYQCKNNKSHPVRLKRGQKDSLITWSFECSECKYRPSDIFSWQCDHKEYGETISRKEKTKYKPLTIRETGVFSPVVKTLVDLPKTENISNCINNDIDFVLLGLYIGSFKGLTKQEISTLADLDDFYSAAGNKVSAKQYFLGKVDIKQTSDEELLRMYKKELGIPFVEKKIEELKKEYENVNVPEFRDFIALLGTFNSDQDGGPITYEKYLKSECKGLKEQTQHEKIEKYRSLVNDVGIKEIRYLPKVKLLSSYIGHIKGPNKFYEPNFVAHFEPIWKEDKKRNELEAYTYPFETEGVMIELNAELVVNWLYANEKIETNVSGADDAAEVIMKLAIDSPGYKSLETLLHSFSHLLIRNSSVHTGIDYQSCSELIFTNAASIFIYTTNIVNIGGFQYLFENCLHEWLKDLKLEAQGCTFDPVCNLERGACFSCIYLPEYACNYFNKNLDRDVFLAKNGRYKKSFWLMTKS